MSDTLPDETAPGASETATPLSNAEIEAIRREFPILRETVHGQPLNYLDSAATAQRPYAVLDAERAFLARRNAPVHRGAHTFAAEATEEYEAARRRVARFVGADEDELVWTTGATDALNLLATAIGNASLGRGGPSSARVRLRPGDEIVVTEREHHANLIPWQELAARTGATLRVLGVDDNGELIESEFADVIGDRTRIIALAHVSNVLGTISRVEAIVARAREVGALVVLDACQSVPHLPFDFHALGVDAAVFSGHKMLGPYGIGALVARRELLEALPPARFGGSMVTVVTTTEAEFLPPPQRFEAGTQPVSQAVALAAAVDVLDGVGMDRIAAHEAALGRRLVAGLENLEGVRLLGSATAPRIGLASIDLPGLHAHDVGQFLDDRGIEVRVGHHCAQPLHRRLGITASTRASGYLYTTDTEVDAFLAAVPEARAFFEGIR